MGMVFIDYVINDMGRFFIGFVLVIVQYVYGVKYVMVYWFQVILDIWQCMVNND